jgi:hypothetical protein
MRWFVAELVVEVRVGREPADHWDQSLVLIRRRDAASAYRTALRLGRRQETSYRNEDGEIVRWRFVGVAELDKLLDEPKSGVEVFSRMTSDGVPHIPAKKDLRVFWGERNKHRTIRDIVSAPSSDEPTPRRRGKPRPRPRGTSGSSRSSPRRTPGNGPHEPTSATARRRGVRRSSRRN